MYFKPQTPQGDGNNRAFCLLIAFFLFQTTNPARGRKLRQIALLLCRRCYRFQTTNPARGRKLNPVFCTGLRHQEISNHKPRKGTETRALAGRDLLLLNPDFKPQTPQGDGNVRFSMQASGRLSFQTTNPARGRKLGDGRHLLLLDGEFQTTNPARRRKPIAKPAIEPSSGSNFKPQTPQGDGNKFTTAVTRFSTAFQTTNPARGRKQSHSGAFPSWYLSFQITNPARGRKLLVVAVFRRGACTFQTTNPARGRKHAACLVALQPLPAHFKPQTPQGDGNQAFFGGFDPLSAQFQTTNPARGRKPFGFFSRHSLTISFQTTNPARGRKLVEHEPLSIGLDISEHESREGRNRL